MAKNDRKPQADETPDDGALAAADLVTANAATDDAVARAEKAEGELIAANTATDEATGRAEAAEAALEGGGDKPAKENRGEEIADFMKPDYTGSISADQAILRHKAGLCKEGKAKK